MTMTDDDLARIEALCEAATPGPWTVDKKEDTEPNGWTHRWHWIREVAYDGPSYNYNIDGFARREDADFIAESRTAVPALVAEVRRLRAELAEANAMLDWIADNGIEIVLRGDRDPIACERSAIKAAMEKL